MATVRQDEVHVMAMDREEKARATAMPHEERDRVMAMPRVEKGHAMRMDLVKDVRRFVCPVATLNGHEKGIARQSAKGIVRVKRDRAKVAHDRESIVVRAVRWVRK
jgi:hypothetical protein